MKDPLVQKNARIRKKAHLAKVKRLSRLLRRKDKKASEDEIIRRAIDAFNPTTN